MEITVEPNPDDSPHPSGDVAYSSAMPMDSLIHIRHLLVRMENNPNHIGMVVGLVNDATLVNQAAKGMLADYTSGNTGSMRANAEEIVNVIVGKQNLDMYKDWDNNGKINDPSDGYGILLNGNQAGYVGGMIDHADRGGEAYAGHGIHHFLDLLWGDGLPRALDGILFAEDDVQVAILVETARVAA